MSDNGHDCPVICKAQTKSVGTSRIDHATSQWKSNTVWYFVATKLTRGQGWSCNIIKVHNFVLLEGAQNHTTQSLKGEFCWLIIYDIDHASIMYHFNNHSNSQIQHPWVGSHLLLLQSHFKSKLIVPTLTCLAIPKSASLTRPIGSTSIFAPLISL